MLSKDWHLKHINELNPEELEYLLLNIGSKLWRLDNLYHIKDKYNVLAVMRLNDSQRKVLTKYRHNKKIILKSRQQGISTLFLAYNLDSCIFEDGIETGLQSYGLREAEKLADRASLMWELFPVAIKELLNISLITDNKMAMGFSNRSKLSIGNFRGDTLQSLHVSELGKIAKDYPKKAKELKTGAFQAVAKNNVITIESTAEGKTGLFYEMWQTASKKAILGLPLSPLDFQAIFLPWYVDPDCQLFTEVLVSKEVLAYLTKLETKLGITFTDSQKWWYQAQVDILGDDMTQEYPSTAEEAFNQSVEGMYYKEEFKNLKIHSNTYDPNLLVFRAADLGMNDDFVLLFFQLHEVDANDENSFKFNGRYFTPKIIAEYKNSGKALEHYAEICTELNNSLGYVYSHTYVPHDAAQSELIAGITRFDAMKSLGFSPILLPKSKVLDGIEVTRQLLKFVILDSELDFLPTSIQNYRKAKDDKLNVYLKTPVHDIHSHPADALRYLAMGLKYYYPDLIYVSDLLASYRYDYTSSSGNFDV